MKPSQFHPLKNVLPVDLAKGFSRICLLLFIYMFCDEVGLKLWEFIYANIEKQIFNGKKT